MAMAHLPTRIERMSNMSDEMELELWVKRDDCTGIGFGGNKVRQLEYYFGKAQMMGADTVLITGAIQSNYVRSAAAMAGLIQLTAVNDLAGYRVLFWHTGGTPALFGYGDQLVE